MYKKVETKEELEIFDSIWIPAWQEKGFELECLLGSVDRYLIHNNENKYIGSVSFRPYEFDSTIDDVFPFYQNEKVRKNIGSIIEIDKLALLKENRRNEYLEKLLFTVAEYGRIHQTKKCIATLDALFYRTLKFLYPFSIEVLHRKIHYKNTILVPVVINMDETFLNLEKYKWINDFYQSNKLLIEL